ncbi:MAG: CBS domain-containing protein [Myxococcales bacterium]|nr:CBS domain-containing protein [Myxococcales bacterium]
MADIMTEGPTTVTETTSIGDAMGVMSDEGVRHLPVVRGSDVVGMLSDRDVGKLGVSLFSDVEGYEQMKAKIAQPVSIMMTGGVVTVDQDSDVSEAVDLMLDEKLGALCVVESGTSSLVGIVSYVDVLKAARDALDSL